MILYDLTAVQSQGHVKYHGGGLYAKIILQRMLDLNIQFCGFWDSRRYIEKELIENIEVRGIRIFDLAKYSFEEITTKINNPIVFSILPKEYMFIVPTIGTVHDCREIELENDIWEYRYQITAKRYIFKSIKIIFDSYFKRRNLLRFKKFISNPNFIPTTITKYTKDRIRHWINEKSDMPIFMTPFSEDNHKPEYIPYDKDKYFLLVSGDRWLKNNLRVIVALDQLFTIGELSEFKVKITGIDNINNFRTKIKNKTKFECLGYVETPRLAELYKYAYCFIFPSLYEGFGIPPLEAMKFGTPVIASNKSAIPEVCGSDILYFDPKSIPSIKNRIIEIAKDKTKYEIISKAEIIRYEYMNELASINVDKYLYFVLQHDKRI